MTFAMAVKRLPKCCVGSLDFLSHRTVADLRAIVQHELDLYEEGEETDIRHARDVRSCRRFLDATRPVCVLCSTSHETDAERLRCFASGKSLIVRPARAGERGLGE